MEVTQLKYFLEVAHHLSFSKAAEELGLSQPTLSRSIAKLESEVGQPVFERQTRSLQLTQAGELLKPRARQIIDLIEDTLSEITDDPDTGELRVGAIPTIAPFFLPGLLQQFGNTHPKANVKVREDPTEFILESCRQGELDLAIVALPIKEKYLDVVELFEEELILVIPPGHELTERENITLKQLKEYPFVLLNEAHCLSDNIISFCQKSFDPKSAERINQLATVQELVSLDHGISMIPEMAKVKDESARRVYRRLASPVPKRTIALVTNPYRFESQLQKSFVQCVLNYVKDRKS